ncbi:MAG: GH3 auxin-responsive promoter family protein, partial [Bacteroidota bacterium]|nr:GH3 auxin-responsive promoter family protein [Bacteroidota bacterium]
MSLRKLIAKQLAKLARKKINQWSSKPIDTQQKVLKQLIEKAKHTAFGKDHNFDQIQSHK